MGFGSFDDSFSDSFDTVPSPPARQVEYVLRIRNPRTLRLVAVIGVYGSMSWTRRSVEAGDFSLAVPAAHIVADDLQHPNLIEVLRDGETEFVGVMQHCAYDATKEEWTISGQDIKGFWLSARITHPGDEEFAAQVNVPAEMAMKHYLAANLTEPADPLRDVHAELEAGFTVESDLARGATVNYNTRWRPLLDVLNELAEMGGLTHDVLLQGAGAVPYYEYVVRERRDATATGGTPVIFSVTRFSNVAEAEYVRDALRLTNACYALGAGEGVARDRREVVDEQSIASSFRRESVIDARQADTVSKLEEAATLAIAQSLRDMVSARMQPLLVGPTLYRAQWDVGDDVTLEFAAIGVQADVRIDEVTVTIEGGEETVRVALGRRPQTLARIFSEVVARVRQVQVA